MRQFLLRADNEYALVIDNEPDSLNGFAVSTFENGGINGGVKITGGGDSIAFRNVTFSGQRGIKVQLNTQVKGGFEASQFLLDNVNSTAEEGIHILTGTRTRVLYSNLELGGKRIGSGNALIYLEGTEKENIAGSTIIGNFLAPIAAGKSAIHLHCASGTRVENNTITAAYQTYGIVIDSCTKNAYIGYNLWETSKNFEILDNGQGTMGIVKDLSQGASYLKLPIAKGGLVKLFGAIQGSEDAAKMKLPVGFRPVEQIELSGITFLPDGSITLRENRRYELSGIEFIAPLLP